jgi:hypothetical protein
MGRSVVVSPLREWHGGLVPETAGRTFALPAASNRAQQPFPPNAH